MAKNTSKQAARAAKNVANLSKKEQKQKIRAIKKNEEKRLKKQKQTLLQAQKLQAKMERLKVAEQAELRNEKNQYKAKLSKKEQKQRARASKKKEAKKREVKKKAQDVERVKDKRERLAEEAKRKVIEDKKLEIRNRIEERRIRLAKKAEEAKRKVIEDKKLEIRNRIEERKIRMAKKAEAEAKAKRDKELHESKSSEVLMGLLITNISNSNHDHYKVFNDVELLKSFLRPIVAEYPSLSTAANELLESTKKRIGEGVYRDEANINKLVSEFKQNPYRKTNNDNIPYDTVMLDMGAGLYLEAVYRTFKDEVIAKGISATAFRIALDYYLSSKPYELYEGTLNSNGNITRSRVLKPAREIADMAISRALDFTNIRIV